MRCIAVLLAAGLATATVGAQGDFDFDKMSPATLKATLRLDYKGAPSSKMMAFMLSLNGGPTALSAMFGYPDPRSIEVGVDFIDLWIVLSTTSTGDGTFNIPIPDDASLAGLPVHVQLMTAGTGTQIVDKISNKIVIVAGATGSTSTLTAKLGDGRMPPGPGRALMSVFPIKNKNGNVMLAGGGTGHIFSAKGLATTEIFDFRKMTIAAGPNMKVARALHTATVLQDGRVLLAGGVDNNGVGTATSEIYNPATNTFSATGSMAVARAGHAAALLADGRVLVTAGTVDLSDLTKAILGLQDTAEIFNPTTGKWTATRKISAKILAPALTTLGSGKVLLSGGAQINWSGPFPVSTTSRVQCELFDASTGTWTATGSMIKSRGMHDTNTILLTNGRVLVTGGVQVNIALLPPPSSFAGAVGIKHAEYYVPPPTGKWFALPDMATERFGQTVIEMPNGRVLVIGGAKGAIDVAIATTSIQEFNPATNAFVRNFPLKAARAVHGGALFPDDGVIVFGGSSTFATVSLKSLELIHQ